MSGSRTNRARKARPRKPADELTFRPSAENSLGLELELQVLHPETGDLAPGGVRILDACAEEGLDAATAELMQSMVEVRTGVCRDVAAATADLLPTLRRVRHIATSLGYDLAMGGMHPFTRAGTGAVSPFPRYERVAKRMAGMVGQFTVFGLHVHVGVPGGDAAVTAANELVPYLPHLVALSANSPFWHGVDTGLVSARAAMFRLSPRAGTPRYFPDWDGFCEYFRFMRDCGVIAATKDIYWDVRPRPLQGTVEVRVCDMPSDLDVVFGLAALIRALVTASVGRAAKAKHARRPGAGRAHWVADENKWLALRYGLKAEYFRTPGAPPRTLAEDLEELLEKLRPVARRNGDLEFLKVFAAPAEYESGAERQRRLYRESGDWADVLGSMKSGWVETVEKARSAGPESKTARPGAPPGRAGSKTK
ncbi:MAG TPA: YbdK family carboxylate-amine ligase [Gemmataceae bacterium]